MNRRVAVIVASIALQIQGVVVLGQTLVRGTATEPAEDNRLGVVLDEERSDTTDVLFLRNGDKLAGNILNDQFGLRTSYGQLNLSAPLVAGINLEGGANNIESIITVNNNRFSGFLDDFIFSVKLDSGPLVQVRREKVAKAIFHKREGERNGLQQNQFIELKNGDFFSGTVMNGMITVDAAYGEVPVKLNTIDTIEISDGDFPVVKVAQTNDNIVKGTLKTEDIQVMLDIGAMVKIYQDRIDTIYCQKGFVPDSAKIVGGAGQMVKVASLDQLMDRFIGGIPASNGLGIGPVPADSPFFGVLQKGDVIESMNGEPYGKGMLSTCAKALISGETPVLTFEVKRGDESLTVRITKE